MKLTDRVAIVTGGSQGIGRAIALELAEHGADVVVNFNKNLDGAKAAIKEILSLRRRAMIIQGDVSKKSDVDQMVQTTLKEFGKIDILVNNAGIYVPRPLEDLSEEDWDRVIEVNLKGVFLCSQAVGKHLIQRKSGGSIINVASIASLMPEIYAGAYTPSKAGVIGLTHLLAVEWAKYGIRANSLDPGPVMTLMQRQAYPNEELLEARNRSVPLKRHGTPKEMAKVVVFLASDDSSYITGENIAADGGSLVSMYYLVRQLAER